MTGSPEADGDDAVPPDGDDAVPPDGAAPDGDEVLAGAEPDGAAPEGDADGTELDGDDAAV
jgi:hypothetical protein